jgi:hypothetical protein
LFVIDVTKRKWFIAARNRRLRLLLREWLQSRRNTLQDPEQNPARKAEDPAKISGGAEDINV